MSIASFWNNLFLTASTESHNKYELNLIENCQKYFGSNPTEKQIESLFISAMIARIIASDLNVNEEEKKFLRIFLKSELHLTSESEIEEIINLSINWAHDFAQLEGQIVGNYFRKHYISEEKRYHFLKFLFKCSACDGEITNVESEELRLITHALDLSPQHFLAARAEYKDYLLSLKK